MGGGGGVWGLHSAWGVTQHKGGYTAQVCVWGGEVTQGKGGLHSANVCVWGLHRARGGYTAQMCVCGGGGYTGQGGLHRASGGLYSAGGFTQRKGGYSAMRVGGGVTQRKGGGGTQRKGEVTQSKRGGGGGLHCAMRLGVTQRKGGLHSARGGGLHSAKGVGVTQRKGGGGLHSAKEVGVTQRKGWGGTQRKRGGGGGRYTAQRAGLDTSQSLGQALPHRHALSTPQQLATEQLGTRNNAQPVHPCLGTSPHLVVVAEHRLPTVSNELLTSVQILPSMGNTVILIIQTEGQIISPHFF